MTPAPITGSGNGHPDVPFDKSIIPVVLRSILGQTRFLLGHELGIRIEQAEEMEYDVKRLKLQEVTAIAGLGGPISLLIAFSFERRLLEAIYDRLTHDIQISPEERDTHVRDAAAETVNTILGLCTGDFRNLEKSVSLSPPLVIDDGRCIQRPKNAVFASMRIRTEQGYLGVGLVGPRHLFDDLMNYQQQQHQH